MEKTHTREAAQPRKSPRAFKLIITAPIEVKPMLAAIASYFETTPESYALNSLLSHLKCDAENFSHESIKIIIELERGQA